MFISSSRIARGLVMSLSKAFYLSYTAYIGINSEAKALTRPNAVLEQSRWKNSSMTMRDTYIALGCVLVRSMVKERVIGGRGVVTELYNMAVSLIEPRLAESFTRQSRNQADPVASQEFPQTRRLRFKKSQVTAIATNTNCYEK